MVKNDKILKQFKTKMVDEMLDIYDKYPEVIKHLDDAFWDLMLDTSEKYNVRRQIQGFSK